MITNTIIIEFGANVTGIDANERNTKAAMAYARERDESCRTAITKPFVDTTTTAQYDVVCTHVFFLIRRHTQCIYIYIYTHVCIHIYIYIYITSPQAERAPERAVIGGAPRQAGP